MKRIEVLFNGLILQVEVTSYTKGRPAPIAATPDCPGYDDEGEAEEVEYEIISAEIDCHSTHLNFLYKCIVGLSGRLDDDMNDAVCEKIREEQE